MAILVDDARWAFKNQMWCHLVSDTSLDELHVFARAMHLPESLFHGDHYDLPEAYRGDAIAAGAQPVPGRELVTRLRNAGLRCTPAERREVKAAQRARRISSSPSAGGGITRLAWRIHIGPHDDHLEYILAKYQEPGRAYHSLSHIDDVVSHVSDLFNALSTAGGPAISERQRANAMAAAIYHDMIYDATASDNELASAELARRVLTDLGWDEDRVDAVATMIEGTADHLDPPDLVTAVLFDADLAILGADPVHYQRYVTGVRREYGHVSDDAWKIGRPRVLRSYLDRPRLYATEDAARRWAEPARINMATELDDLTGIEDG